MKSVRRLPWVIPEYCEGCTSCIAACPHGALKIVALGPEEHVPWIDDPSMCTGCGRCADSCGLGGIAMTGYVDEARQRFLAGPRERLVS